MKRILLAATLLVCSADARAQYFQGTSGADTIVYGDVIHRYWFFRDSPPCSGWVYTNLGPGACRFAYDAGGTNYRASGEVPAVPFDANNCSPSCEIRGDPPGGSYGGDVVVYAADQFGEGFVWCNVFERLAISGVFYSEACTNQEHATANFARRMTIHGDAASSSVGANDRIWGHNGYDILHGNGGQDTLRGGGTYDDLFGEDGPDTLYADGCNSSWEVLSGGNGSDYIYGSDTSSCYDLIWGGADNDMIWGYAGDDVIYGQAGRDTIYGGAGQDRLDGGDDNVDVVVGGSGNDTLYGGPGAGDSCVGDYGSSDTCDASCESKTAC